MRGRHKAQKYLTLEDILQKCDLEVRKLYIASISCKCPILKSLTIEVSLDMNFKLIKIFNLFISLSGLPYAQHIVHSKHASAMLKQVDTKRNEHLLGF